MSTSEQETRIEIGADVVAQDETKVGTVASIVVRPPTMAITDIVVSMGAFLGREVVLPLDVVTDVDEDGIHISIPKERLRTYPDYIEVHYRQPPADWVPPLGATYPPTGILWPDAAYTVPEVPEPESVRVNAPPGTVGISEGMDVESSDGHHIGSVEAVETDPASQQITGLVVKHGFLFTGDTRVPMDHVASVEEGKVVLTLTKEEVKRLEHAADATES